jgi:hypothetical protein
MNMITAPPREIPVGLCQCGCGQHTPIAVRSYTCYGIKKGVHTRFVVGHSSRTTGTGAWYKHAAINGVAVYDHVSIAELALGHPLPKGAEIHHVDNNKRNNANTNLVICQDHQFHFFLHVRAKVVRAGGNPNTQRICSHCHRLTFFNDLVGGYDPSQHRKKRSGECKTCTAEIHRQRRDRARREQLS